MGYQYESLRIVDDVEDPPVTNSYAMDFAPEPGNSLGAGILCQQKDTVVYSSIVSGR